MSYTRDTHAVQERKPSSKVTPSRQILMVQGMGNNERGTAEYLSKYGRVTLVQLGAIEHVETWEMGKLTFSGPEMVITARRKWDEALFGLPSLVRTLVLVRRLFQKSKVDLVLVSFYSSALAALILRRLGKVRKVVVLLCDYLPLRGSWLVRMHRRITGWLMYMVTRWSDEAWAVSPRIPTTQANPRRFVAPLRVSEPSASSQPRSEIAYIGFPSYDHALDILFDICKRHDLRLNIIGHSSYLDSIKAQAPSNTVFHGILNDPAAISTILSRCFCGYAVYRDTSPASYSYYGIPSKTLACLTCNTPVVITNAAHFTQIIQDYGVGRVVAPDEVEIEAAILDLRDRYHDYARAIDRFRVEWKAHFETFHDDRMAALLGH